MAKTCIVLVCLLGFAFGDNNITFGESTELTHPRNSLDVNKLSQGVSWGEWTWSKWSPCSRSCGGGVSRQQKRCRRKPCKGKQGNPRYKVCNNQVCDNTNDFRGEQCAAFNNIPYSGQLLKWFPHYDPNRPCSLICRGEQTSSNNRLNRNRHEDDASTSHEKSSLDNKAIEDFDETILVQLAEKVKDGTKCQLDNAFAAVCIAGECMKVACDMRVGGNKKMDVCGVCGGNGSTCQSKYVWSLESISACSKSCGGGFKIAMATCKSTGEENVVDDTFCDPDERPEKTLMPCNTHPCPTKWITGEWSKCSASCGGGSKTRAVFCTEENGNETTKLPDYKCSDTLKPRYQEACNSISCPMWETNQWSECSVSCGIGVRTRKIECRDGNGRLSDNCDPSERPHVEQECRSNVDCPIYGEDLTQPLMQPHPPPPVPEKLIDQPIPSESTFVAEEWSSCSVTCGEGFRHREVHCKIFLEFSRTIARLSDRQCAGPKPVEMEKCVLEPCGTIENSLSYRLDTVGDSGYADSGLPDTYRSSSSSGGSSSYENTIKVAAGGSVQTTYSWKEAGYSPCSATCLGGIQNLIINCVRDDTGKTVMPLLCTPETKPESRFKTCNDHPCPPRWNYSDFSPCLSPCGIGIQTRDVVCIHEVISGGGNTVPVPNHLCPQPPPADRQYCNVWDCPVKWQADEWSKCSRTCGGGVKRRKVTCEQVMAQGRRQSREDHECPAQKPATEKPCNTRPCQGGDVRGHQTLIFSLNTTFNQTDINDKVDLKIGGIANVFQGTAFIKIRCPVKKFDKAHIIWEKDGQELQKSKKYKISRKGALKVNAIVRSDTGVYTCRAGEAQAETTLMVKPRSPQQMSSEEFLRLGNSVHLVGGMANSDVAAASSGESLRTEHAAYGNRFGGNDNEDLSHERVSPSKPTKKPHKKQRTTPSPESTIIRKDHTVTSLNQPGYHESVESTAASSASTLVPFFSQIVNNLKAYWPIERNGDSRAKGIDVVPDNPSENSHKENWDSRTGQRIDVDYSDDVKIGPDMLLQGKTMIPDNTFGPDEERIFIDDDPYDFGDVIFSLHNREDGNGESSTASSSDYFEQALKNAKNERSPLRNRRPDGKRKADESTIEVFYLRAPDLDSKSDKRQILEKRSRNNEAKEKTEEIRDETLATMEEGFERNHETNSNVEEVLKKRTLPVDGDDRETTTLNSESVTPEIVTESGDFVSPGGKDPRFDSANLTDIDENADEVFQLEELKNNFNSSDNKFNNSENLESFTAGPIVDSNTGSSEDLIYEWVTTEWSSCSQTCGGGGFQMRGAQCTVRSVKPLGNSTRVPPKRVIGANLCEDAGFPMPEKVRTCGDGRCPQWHTTEWTPCESSRCFNWKTAMQRRDVNCILEETNQSNENLTILDSNKCDEITRPLQRQECYNDACKGVWRVGEWSECTAPCDEDGIKYRILQCVWYGTKKPAGNACRDIPRPPVMKTCRGPKCLQTPEQCKDQSQLCSRVKMMHMCRVPLYQKQCCKSCP